MLLCHDHKMSHHIIYIYISFFYRSRLFAYPDLITDGTVAMSCSLSLFIIPVTAPTVLLLCRDYLDLLLKRIKRNQVSIRRLFPTSSSNSTSSTSTSSSISTCYSPIPITFSPVPILIERDKLEIYDNMTPFKSIRIEEFNKVNEEKKEKEDKEEDEVDKVDKRNIETNSNVLNKIENDKTHIVNNDVSDINGMNNNDNENEDSNKDKNENKDKNKDENRNKDNDKYEEGHEELCTNIEHNFTHKTHERNRINKNTNNVNIYTSKRTDEKFDQCERRITVKKKIDKTERRRSKNDIEVSEEEEEDDNYYHYEKDEQKHSKKNEYKSKNEHGIETRRRRIKERSKGTGRIRMRRKEGAIMEWSAIGSLNWDIMFLLGGGFALSEGFQVRVG